MSLARRNLLQDKVRVLISVTGVALAIMLILILTGFVSGMNRQVSRYLDHTPGSVVLVQAGTRGASSVLPAEVADTARTVEGVTSAVPVLSQYAVLDLGSTKQYVIVVGYDSAFGGGPWVMREGRRPSADDEVVLDGVLADRRGVHVGDEFALMGRSFKVVGLSDGTTTWMTSYLFMSLRAAQTLFGSPRSISMVMVTPEVGLSAADLRSRLSGLPGVDAMLKSDVIASSRSSYLSIFAAPLGLMATIAALVGTLVVGMVIYTATVERQREYGVLKAVGARNQYLYRLIGAQALAAALAGSVLGVGLAYAGAQLIMALRPQFLIAIEAQSIAMAMGAGLVMALLAAMVPARILARLAPAEVFRR